MPVQLFIDQIHGCLSFELHAQIGLSLGMSGHQLGKACSSGYLFCLHGCPKLRVLFVDLAELLLNFFLVAIDDALLVDDDHALCCQQRGQAFVGVRQSADLPCLRVSHAPRELSR